MWLGKLVADGLAFPASAARSPGALYSSLMGRTEAFVLPVDSCLLKRLRKTSVACENEGGEEEEEEKKRGVDKRQTPLAITVVSYWLLYCL